MAEIVRFAQFENGPLDKTAHPHYLSWSPIGTEKPDFHRPEFFGELVLA